MKGRVLRMPFVLAVSASMLLVSCADEPPSTSECVDGWNTAPAVRHVPHAVGVIVSGWTDKAGDRGCAVVVVEANDGRWTSYSSVSKSGAIRWDAVSGNAWGSDSPEGGPTGFNASVTEHGSITLLP